MVFLRVTLNKAQGGTRALRVPNPAAGISADTIKAASARIISANIFAGETLSTLNKAEVISTSRIKMI